MDCSPPGSPVPGILQARTLEWAAISFSNAWKCKVKVQSLSHVRLLATPWTAAYQAPSSMGFSRQEYWARQVKTGNHTAKKWRTLDSYPGPSVSKAWLFPHITHLRKVKSAAKEANGISLLVRTECHLTKVPFKAEMPEMTRIPPFHSHQHFTPALTLAPRSTDTG